jgi:hypothetical protein
LCPSSSLPFISALTLQPQQCTANVIGTCPGNYFCWYSNNPSTTNAYFCCQENRNVDSGLCPPQLRPIRGTGAGLYRACSPQAVPNSADACDINSQCQFAERLSQYICCGSDSTLKPNVCPPSLQSGVTLVPYFEGSDYRECNPNTLAGLGSCPRDAACLYINPTIRYICCRNPSNSTPITVFPTLRRRTQNEIDGDVLACGVASYTSGGKACSPQDASSCGDNEHCMYNTKTKVFNCCMQVPEKQLQQEQQPEQRMHHFAADAIKINDDSQSWWTKLFG